jgi:hypothetical protein
MSKKIKKNKKKKIACPVALAEVLRHASTTTVMRDRRSRRPKDARRAAEDFE